MKICGYMSNGAKVTNIFPIVIYRMHMNIVDVYRSTFIELNVFDPLDFTDATSDSVSVYTSIK